MEEVAPRPGLNRWVVLKRYIWEWTKECTVNIQRMERNLDKFRDCVKVLAQDISV